MSVADTYTKLLQLNGTEQRRVSEDNLHMYPSAAHATKTLHRAAVYRQGFVDNPDESSTGWAVVDRTDVAEVADQRVELSDEKVLVEAAQYVISVPHALVNLYPHIANWLLETHDAATIDSMWRLAADYVQTVTEMYNERTTK